MTKLYIVEGLPCSGKSTTSKYIADLLEKSGKKVCFFDEGSGNHPTDYEFPMYETMMRFNLAKEESFEYIEQIYHIISPLEPMIIYLKNDDVAEQIKTTSEERTGWLDAVIDYHVNGGFGKSISAEGFDGYLECLKERQRRELEYLKMTKLPSIIIENAHRNWQQAYDKIVDRIFLD